MPYLTDLPSFKQDLLTNSLVSGFWGKANTETNMTLSQPLSTSWSNEEDKYQNRLLQYRNYQFFFTVPNQLFVFLLCDMGLDSADYISTLPAGSCQVLPIEGAGRRL